MVKQVCCCCDLATLVYLSWKYPCALFRLISQHRTVENTLRPYCGLYDRPLISTVARSEHVTAAQRKRARDTGDHRGCLHPCRAPPMKHRSPSEQHHGKRSRVPGAAASSSQQDGMEDKTPSIPRELTQNPLKKIWMPCKNGLPEKHISQRKGTYYNVAAVVSVRAYSCGTCGLM